MSFSQIGAANLVGILVYLATSLAAIATALRVPKSVLHGRATWLAVAALFFGLALFRLGNGEDVIRQALRGYLLVENEYSSRRTFQAVAVLVCLGLAGLLGLWAIFRFAHWPRWRIVIAASLGALALFYCLRIISLHSVDRLLYASLGPLHLNHLLELLPIIAIWYTGWTTHWRASSPKGRGRR